jgi:hypothetical protein
MSALGTRRTKKNEVKRKKERFVAFGIDNIGIYTVK